MRGLLVYAPGLFYKDFVSLLNRLKPFFLPAAIAAAIACAHWLGPIEADGVVWFIMYGIGIGEIDRRLNPRPEHDAKGPLTPWNQMDAGDRLEYFFPALIVAVPGILLLTVAALWSGSFSDKLIPLAFAALMVGSGTWIAYDKWRNRWGAVEAA